MKYLIIIALLFIGCSVEVVDEEPTVCVVPDYYTIRTIITEDTCGYDIDYVNDIIDLEEESRGMWCAPVEYRYSDGSSILYEVADTDVRSFDVTITTSDCSTTFNVTWLSNG